MAVLSVLKYLQLQVGVPCSETLKKQGILMFVSIGRSLDDDDINTNGSIIVVDLEDFDNTETVSHFMYGGGTGSATGVKVQEYNWVLPRSSSYRKVSSVLVEFKPVRRCGNSTRQRIQRIWSGRFTSRKMAPQRTDQRR